MASALVVGLAAAGAFGATTAGIITAAALSVAAAAADRAFMRPDKPDQPGQFATPIDKTQLQKEAEIGKLQLGEAAEKKRKRRKGKAAFKIELDKADIDAGPDAVTAPEAKTAGLQL